MLKPPSVQNGEQIYLDYHATTPVDPVVLEAILPYFSQIFGNPASEAHAWGWAAQGAVEAARSEVASFLGAKPDEILFTSGATESNNHAILGVMQADYFAQAEADAALPKGHIVTVATEHKSVLDPVAHLKKLGFSVTVLPVEPGTGLVKAETVLAALQPDTKLVSVMLANNEIGTIQPVQEISKITRPRGIVLHCDAVQGASYLDCNVEILGVDLLSLSAHKLYGPKGAGALFIRRKNPRISLSPLLRGGGQERGLRSGTLNVPGIVGLAKACTLAAKLRKEEAQRLRNMRNRLWDTLKTNVSNLRLNGPLENHLRLPHNLNFTVSGVMPEALLTDLRHLALSTGSACVGDSSSHVMKALYPELRDDAPHSLTLRIGLGRFTTDAQLEKASEILVSQISKAQEKFKNIHS